jgi:hypothetical protein
MIKILPYTPCRKRTANTYKSVGYIDFGDTYLLKILYYMTFRYDYIASLNLFQKQATNLIEYYKII